MCIVLVDTNGEAASEAGKLCGLELYDERRARCCHCGGSFVFLIWEIELQVARCFIVNAELVDSAGFFHERPAALHHFLLHSLICAYIGVAALCRASCKAAAVVGCRDIVGGIVAHFQRLEVFGIVG